MAVLVGITGLANGQQPQTAGLPIALGDSIAEVKRAYQLQAEPEPYENYFKQKGSRLRLKDKGVWVFFDAQGLATIIRLEAPFAGSIAGIRIGDDAGTLEKTLGNPPRPPLTVHQGGEAGDSLSYHYRPHETFVANFRVSSTGAIETIFLARPGSQMPTRR